MFLPPKKKVKGVEKPKQGAKHAAMKKLLSLAQAQAGGPPPQLGGAATPAMPNAQV